ncbi:histidine kinase [bacterium]|nr:histidine kinase [bacterium]MCI0603744.1 histidine kinase [bacterium]
MLTEPAYDIRLQTFQNLMQHQIRDVLLVSSLYDLYLFEEDGRLYDQIRNEYQGLSLSHAPEIMRVSSAWEALQLAREKKFDLIITTLHVEDMSSISLARKVQEAGLNVPVVLLNYDNQEYLELTTYHDTTVFDGIFIWQGDFRIIIAIIKHLEDRMNVDSDTRVAGVQSIILVEDNVLYYSKFLPIIYSEILKQSERLISEGVNLTHKYLRMRARPKILLCRTYEQAWDYYKQYKECISGIISDVDFLRNGVHDPAAGLEFIRNVKVEYPDIPVLLHSTIPENQPEANTLGAAFLLKDSPTLLHELQQFITTNFSFGDFIFRMPDNTEVGRATDLPSLEEQLRLVPDESVKYHAERNHFSHWLKARTEFWLAHKLRPRKLSDYPSVTELREDIISSLREYRRLQQLGQITDFRKESFDPTVSFARIGGGSLGGKARGLGFLNVLINNQRVRDQFEGIHIDVPPGIVIGTDVFDQFLAENDLHTFALSATDDREITRRFVAAAKFPRRVVRELTEFLKLMQCPLAVRSSSLLEDSQYHPFAGVYQTYMIPNNSPVMETRLKHLINTIKKVYASTFCQAAKDYIRVTTYRLEEEKMAVIIQRMVGTQHQSRFYPDVSGVARSHNYYPIAPQKSADGIVSVALGLGKTIVDGGNAVRFCPKYPKQAHPYSSAEERLQNSQDGFFALQMENVTLDSYETFDTLLAKHGLEEAEKDETLRHVGSTYSPENDAIYDGLARAGVRLVTFAPILKDKIFPLPQILESLLHIGTSGMGAPVEMEFAVNLSVPQGQKCEFGVLQVRPMVLSRESEVLNVNDVMEQDLICKSGQVLGNGIIHLHDMLVVDPDRFDRTKSREVAAEIGLLNEKLLEYKAPYLLVGVGRWGTLDPWLGIPVKYDQICGARVIVEAGMKGVSISPSQGSHFFQNITSFMVGYFTIQSNGFIDWDWIRSQRAVEERNYTKHLSFNLPIVIKINGHSNQGIILKPA